MAAGVGTGSREFRARRQPDARSRRADHRSSRLREGRLSAALTAPQLPPAVPKPQAASTFAKAAAQAARTELRNLPTSRLSRSLSPESDFAAPSTWAEADPASLAPRCTSAMLAETCCVPCAA